VHADHAWEKPRAVHECPEAANEEQRRRVVERVQEEEREDTGGSIPGEEEYLGGTSVSQHASHCRGTPECGQSECDEGRIRADERRLHLSEDARLRLYGSESQILDASYRLPAVKRVV
jgi:hypothetical protein